MRRERKNLKINPGMNQKLEYWFKTHLILFKALKLQKQLSESPLI